MSKKLTTEEFIHRATDIHKDQYDYSKVRYVGFDLKVLITCKEHGDFYQTPNKHLGMRGCPKCGRQNASSKLARGLDNFISQARILHSDKFDYSKVNYVNDRVKVEIMCPLHGLFMQS